MLSPLSRNDAYLFTFSVTAVLSKICSTSVRYPCAVVSVVGRQLRNALSELGRAMYVLEGVPVHMISEAAEDLNLSFVVDEEHADGLVQVRRWLQTSAHHQAVANVAAHLLFFWNPFRACTLRCWSHHPQTWTWIRNSAPNGQIYPAESL